MMGYEKRFHSSTANFGSLLFNIGTKKPQSLALRSISLFFSSLSDYFLTVESAFAESAFAESECALSCCIESTAES